LRGEEAFNAGVAEEQALETVLPWLSRSAARSSRPSASSSTAGTGSALRTNAETIRWSFEQLNRHDAEAMSTLWTDETYERFPDRDCHGAAEIRAYFEDDVRRHPRPPVEILSLVEQGDEVFVRWRLSGTQQGRLQGIEGTGRRIRLDGVDHFTLRDGKIALELRDLRPEPVGLARSGLMPEDGSGGDRALKGAFNARVKLARAVQARRSTS
jgi:predicted ester cyclase